jgi:immune inhibitor A
VASKGIVFQPVSFAAPQPLACASAALTWSFGDSTTGSGQSTTHSYQHPGTYQWSVTIVSGAQNCTRSGTVEVAPAVSRSRAVRH